MSAPVVSAQPLLDALKDAIAARGIAYAVGQKPTVTAGHPWIVAWPDFGTITNRSLSSRDGFSMVVVLQCYGLSPESAGIASRKSRAAVLGLHRAEVGGRVLLMPEHRTGPPLTRDDDVDPPIWMQVDEWRFRTTPA